jgi:2-dehydropantoate 2-reductase
LFTVKCYDTDATIAQMERALPQAQGKQGTPPVILSLQNGVRSEIALAAAFGPEQVVAGTELNPISTPEPGTVLLEKWKGGIGLAPLIPGVSIERWVQLFDGAVLPTRPYQNYLAMKWSKLMLNLIGNASAAILDMSTVEVFDHPGLFELEVDMLRECATVMRGLQVSPTGLPGYPVPWLTWGVRYAPFFLLRPILRKLVAGGRGDKPPSLLLDLRRGKSRSEVSDLNGSVVRAGDETGLPTPVNRALTETLLGLAAGRLDWNDIRRQPEVLLAVVEEMKRKARSG